MDISPENIQQMTEEEINAHSKAAWDAFYGSLGRLIGRYEPVTWTQHVAHQLRRLRDNPNLMGRVPPHILLRSIEANAAYWRNGNRYEFTPRRFHQVVVLYMDHNDPLLLSFAAKDMTAMLILFHREQFQLQVQYNIIEAVRIWIMFVENDPLPKTTLQLVERFGITPLQWVQLAYLTFAKAIADENSRLTFQNLVDTAKQIMPAEVVEKFARRTVWTVEELQKHYIGVRESTPKQFHAFIRSAFLERPGMDFGQGRWIVPDPVLTMNHMGAGLYRMLTEVWKTDHDLRSEFAASFEKYAALILDVCGRKLALHSENAIQKLANGKSCDFILETEDAVVLVECKGVAFQKDLLLAEVMQDDSSTARLIDAGEQLNQTYLDLQAGCFDTLIQNRSKPVVSLVVTYGTIPYVNSSWYLEKVIRPRAQRENRPLVSPTFGLPTRPVVMSVPVLEMFITTINTLGKSPDELVNEQEAHNELSMGEYENFLKRKLLEVKPDWFAFVEPAHERFVDSFRTEEQRRTRLRLANWQPKTKKA